MTLRRRLARLERSGPDGSCLTCRERRGLTPLVTVRQMAHESGVPFGSEPAPGAWCGQVPEQIIEVVEVVMDAPSARP
jgi:hypothetical protein